MVAILHWYRDIVIQPVRSIKDVHDMKRRMGNDNMEFIIHDSVLPCCPIRMDLAYRELAESEILEWMQTVAYPALQVEGRMVKNIHGKWVKAAAGDA